MASIIKRNWRTKAGEQKVAWQVNYVDANGTRGRQQFSTKREADAFLVKIQGQIQGGTYRADATKFTVKDAADQFLVHCEGRMKRSERMSRQNYKTYEGHVRNYICPDRERHAGKSKPKRLKSFEKGIAAVKLGQLSARAVGDFRDALRDAGVTVPTCRKILGTLQQVLNYAISRDLVAVNAAKGVKVIGRRDEGSKKIVPPSKSAMKMLLEVADEDFRVKLIFASATGLRAGEFHALRWQHVNLDAGEVTVETRVDAYGDEDVTKTAAGMRTVPLASSVVTLMKEWKLRSKRKKPEDLIFPNKRGHYEGHDNMVKRKFHPLFEKLAERHAADPQKYAEAPARFNWHALRHFAVSTWIEAGLSPKTIQTFAGHSSMQVTMDRYGHLFKSDDHKRAMDAIANDLLRS